MTSPTKLIMARCGSCQGRFLPRPGPCPQCGSGEVLPFPIPPAGRVLAAVELLAPSAGWPAPHRLALVQVAESIRLLALVRGALPSIGHDVVVERNGERYEVAGPGSDPAPAK